MARRFEGGGSRGRVMLAAVVVMAGVWVGSAVAPAPVSAAQAPEPIDLTPDLAIGELKTVLPVAGGDRVVYSTGRS